MPNIPDEQIVNHRTEDVNGGAGKEDCPPGAEGHVILSGEDKIQVIPTIQGRKLPQSFKSELILSNE